MDENDQQESRGGDGGEGGVGAGTAHGVEGRGGGGGINFVGADGSVLDKLPSGMEELVMDPEAICSLDYGLSGLASLAPPQAREKEEQGEDAGWPAQSPQHSAPRGGGAGPPAATAAPGATNASARIRGAPPPQSPPQSSGGGGGRGGGRQSTGTGSRSRSRGTEGSGSGSGNGSRRGKKRKKEDGGGGGDGNGTRGGGGTVDGDGDGSHGGDGGGDGPGGGGGGPGGPGGRKPGAEVEDDAENPKQKAKVRNREHARNTRIRKKQYVESLKVQVGEMIQAQAREERDAELESNKITAERTARRQVVLNMFYLKATEELSPQSWACVLDEGFTCVCPVTPFRHFPPSETQEDHRLIKGIEGMIRDTASLAVFLKSICPRSRNPTGRKLSYQFYTSPEDTVVGANALMCQWLMKTDNATECGAQCEVFSHGMLRAHFSAENRIKRLEMVFDVMSFMQQLQRAVGWGEFRMVPNTVAMAMQASHQARLVLSAEPPYGITYTNEAWTALMGHSPEQAKMFPFTLMNGPAEANNGGALEALVQACIGSSLKRTEMVELSVVTRDMRRLAVAVQAYPLGTPEGATTHLLLVMEEVPVCAPLPPGGTDLFPFV